MNAPKPPPLPKFSIRAKRKKKPLPKMARLAPAACPVPPRPKALTEQQLSDFKDQVLIVLADYKDTIPTPLSVDDPENMGSRNPLSAEGIRIDIAKRIVDNLRLVAKVPKP